MAGWLSTLLTSVGIASSPADSAAVPLDTLATPSNPRHNIEDVRTYIDENSQRYLANDVSFSRYLASARDSVITYLGDREISSDDNYSGLVNLMGDFRRTLRTHRDSSGVQFMGEEVLDDLSDSDRLIKRTNKDYNKFIRQTEKGLEEYRSDMENSDLLSDETREQVVEKENEIIGRKQNLEGVARGLSMTLGSILLYDSTNGFSEPLSYEFNPNQNHQEVVSMFRDAYNFARNNFVVDGDSSMKDEFEGEFLNPQARAVIDSYKEALRNLPNSRDVENTLTRRDFGNHLPTSISEEEAEIRSAINDLEAMVNGKSFNVGEALNSTGRWFMGNLINPGYRAIGSGISSSGDYATSALFSGYDIFGGFGLDGNGQNPQGEFGLRVGPFALSGNVSETSNEVLRAETLGPSGNGVSGFFGESRENFLGLGASADVYLPFIFGTQISGGVGETWWDFDHRAVQNVIDSNDDVIDGHSNSHSDKDTSTDVHFGVSSPQWEMGGQRFRAEVQGGEDSRRGKFGRVRVHWTPGKGHRN